MKSEGDGLIVCAIVSKISNHGPDPPTSQTDRQTDGRHAISIIPRYGKNYIYELFMVQH